MSAAERADCRWAQWDSENLVNAASLVGLLPDVLLEQYVFWRAGENIVRGYALPEAIGSQLLVRLHRRASVSGGIDGGADGDGDKCGGDGISSDVVVADVRRVADELSAGELARANFGGEQTARDAGELSIGVKVRVLSEPDQMRGIFKSVNPGGWSPVYERYCGQCGVLADRSSRGLWRLKFDGSSDPELEERMR